VLGFEVTREDGLSAHLSLKCKCLFAQNLGAKSFGDGSNLGAIAAFRDLIFEKKAFFNFYVISTTV